MLKIIVLSHLKAFARKRDGSVAPVMAISMVVLICCIGFAVDTSRAFLVRARLVDALDAAGLALGSRLATTDYSGDALKFVNANFGSGYAGATVQSVTASVDSAKTLITLSAKATMPTVFMKLVGQTSVTVNANSQITRQTTGLELAMVLDNTGSMASDMSGLKSAANNLVSILFGSSTTATDLFIGVVPFSQAVNIGTSRSNWVSFVNNKKSNWKGCVMARSNGLDQTDDAPASSTYDFDDYYYPNYGGSLYCPSALTPLTNVKSTLTTAINAMTAAGNTHINLGAVWGWRLISPKWRGYWGSLAWNGTTLPLDYGTDKMSKAAIIMTDGDNTMSSGVYTAYGWLSDGKLGTTNATKAEAALDTRLSTVCTSMKSAGVIVYTVAFNNPDSSTKSLLQSCATSSSNYFDASDTTALNTAFQTIGSALSNLRVSQ